MIGFHFHFHLRMNWQGLASVFDERAKLLGCSPAGARLKPHAERAVISGTMDHRLRQGGLRYDIALYNRVGLVDVQLGQTTPNVRVRFGVDGSTRGDWCSSDTLALSVGGLFLPEQRTVDNAKTLPALFVARLDMWETLSDIARIAAGGSVPDNLELPSAQGWKFDGSSGTAKSELVHMLAGMSSTITPMELTSLQ